ncbi:MAG TPA: F0F1 ATP synthase subunit delta [Azoarcus taiwanensis]|nr:F0F1 ATP synthase subunit delta [Azoarcus taiwanensis]
MAENVTIARPYADAAFELAKGADALGPWSEVLAKLAAIVADPAMKECIGDPKLTDDTLFGLIVGVAGDGLNQDQQNFVRLLVENERLKVLPEIRDLFVRLKNDHEGVKEAVITSAFPIDDALLATMKTDLEARFKVRLNIKVSLDPELIGGIRIAVGDDVIDTSVRGKLANMAAALKN